MKKKSLFVLCLMMAMMNLTTINVYSTPVDVVLQTNFEDPKEDQDNPQRTPILVPEVDLDGHTLYLYSVDYDLTLVLVDEEDEVVYTTFIPANTSSVVLPATLSGEYEMLLYPGGDYYFYGWIEL